MWDQLFFDEVEERVGADGMIFQLPYVPFPEHPPTYKMEGYEHFKGYLHSDSIQWSFGVMKGTKEDIAIRKIADRPVEEMIEQVSLAGYDGIFLNRDGYEDRRLEEDIIKFLNIDPLISEDEKFVYFDMSEFNKTFKKKYSESEWESQKTKVLHPIIVDFNTGVYSEENWNNSKWRWAQEEGSIHIWNTSDEAKQVNLRASLSTPSKEAAQVILEGEVLSDTIEITSEITNYSKSIILEPGVNIINFRTSAPKVDAPTDPRDMYFQILDFTVEYDY